MTSFNMKTSLFTVTMFIGLIISSCHMDKCEHQLTEEKSLQSFVSDSMEIAMFELNKLHTGFKVHCLTGMSDSNKRVQRSDENTSRIPVIFCNSRELGIVIDTSNIVPFEIKKYEKGSPVSKESKFYEGYVVNIKNKSLFKRSSVCFGSGYGIIQEAKDSTGVWRPIQYNIGFFGRPFMLKIDLYPQNTLVLTIPKYGGDYKTKLRVKLKTPCFTLYSNEFRGSVSKGQFNVPDTSRNITNDYIYWF